MEMSRFEAIRDRARSGFSQLEAFYARARGKEHPVRGLLARFHRGDAFTKVFSMSLITVVWGVGLLIGLSWLGRWYMLYVELERWQLVLAFVNQFVSLGLWFVLLHVTYLRANHLRQIPPGPFVSLRAAALILRWFGEFAFIAAIGSLAQSVLGVPVVGELASLSGGVVSEGDLQTVFKTLAVFTSFWFPIAGFFVFTVFYVLAGVIEVFFAIERNTRAPKPALAANSEMTGRGREARAPRDNPIFST